MQAPGWEPKGSVCFWLTSMSMHQVDMIQGVDWSLLCRIATERIVQVRKVKIILIIQVLETVASLEESWLERVPQVLREQQDTAGP